MVTIKRISERYYLRQMVIWLLVNIMFFGLPFGALANPNPANNAVPNAGNVISSSTALDWTGSSGLDAVIGSSTGRNLINWNNFDIGKDASVTFTQNGGWVFNNVQAADGMATGIYGKLKGPGCNLVVLNKFGIVFGPQSVTQAKNFAAVGLSMDVDSFLTLDTFDPLNFEYGAMGEVAGNIELKKLGMYRATIEVDETLALVGKNVFNKGKIYTKSPDSVVVMAAGDNLVISKENSHVNVDVSSSTDNENWVKNEGILNTDDAMGKTSLVLAAGDIYSTAISGVESLRATAVFDAEFDGDIDVYGTPGSDAVAEVDIATGSSLTIDHDITAVAAGDGSGEADASINIESGGDLTIRSGYFGSETEILAEATDGTNNTAEVTLEAAGAFTIDAPDKVTVKAKADSDEYTAGENLAAVNIKGSSVLITGTDLGVTDEPATVKAYARDGLVNRAEIDIEATEGDVEIIGAGSNGDSAIILAKAKNGTENIANIAIKAADDVKIIAKEGQQTSGEEVTKALILAKAENAEVSNEASVNIEAGGDIKVISKGGNLNEWTVDEGWWEDQGWYVDQGWWEDQGGYEQVWVESGYWTGPWWNRHWVDTSHWETQWVSNWVWVENLVWHENWVWIHNYVDYSEFTPYSAKVLAIAENAGSSNTANIDMTAGKDVLILAKDGGQVKVLAYTGNALESVNTSNVNITAEDGSVKVLAIDGQYSTEDGFTISEVSVGAKAEDAGGPDGTNSANVTIVARDIPEEPLPPTDIDGDDDSDVILLSDADDDSDDGKVLILGKDGGKAEVESIAKYGDENTATVGIDADNDVKVIAKCNDESSQAEITAIAKYGHKNTAGIDISAGGDVEVLAEYGGKAEVEAMALNDGSIWHYASDIDMDDDIDTDMDVLVVDGIENTATVDITAADDVKVKAECGGDASVEAKAGNEIWIEGIYKVSADGDSDNDLDVAFGDMTNTATVDITATEGDIVVIGKYGSDATVDAEAFNEVETCGPVDIAIDGDILNNAGVAMDAGNKVVVLGKHGSTADVYAETWSEYDGPIVEAVSSDVRNTSDVSVNAGGDVKVLGISGDAWVEALSFGAATNTATVSVDTPGDVKVKAAGCEAGIFAEAGYGIDNTANVSVGGAGHKIGGDVDVIAEHGDAYIESYAHSADNSNNATTLVCTEGKLTVETPESCGYKYASVAAYAECGYQNNANVGVGAVDGVLVKGADGGDAEIFAGTYGGFSNTSETIVCTQGDLIVNAMDGYAAIGSEAFDGYHNDAFTGVCATGHVIVGAGFDAEDISYGEIPGIGEGGAAYIYSEAGSGYEPQGQIQVQLQEPLEQEEPSTATARTVAVSKKGSVVVADLTSEQYPGSAGIEAAAYGAFSNDASVGVAAGSELSTSSAVPIFEYAYVMDVAEEPGIVVEEEIDPLGAGNVVVYAYGPGSDARIESYASNGFENTAEAVVCAPGQVIVAADSYEGGRPIAKIKALAENGEFNTATTRVYASDVQVMVPGLYRGNGIGAWAEGGEDGWIHVEPYYCLANDGSVNITDGQSTLVIDGYASKTGCPDCPPCPCEQEEPPIGPAAPLSRENGEPLEPLEFEQGGCPALMQWFANEVGLPLDQIHVMLSNADFLATDVQPCDACARLKQQSDAMAMDTAAVDAWASTVRAGLTGPITPEMMDGIRTSLADNPAALSFDEAAVEYARILNEELGFESGDAAGVVTDNYASDYSDLSAYINARIGM